MKEMLQEFGLKLEHVVTATTGGAAMMKIFGKLTCCIRQLCFAFGNQLAAMNFLYGGQAESEESEEENQNDEEPEEKT